MTEPRNRVVEGRALHAAEEPASGLSKLSRLVGDNFGELGPIFVHTDVTVCAAPPFDVLDHKYVEHIYATLPFMSQQNVYSAIAVLTIGWGAFACQITLGRLSAAAGIRNIKTIRKWLSDLHKRSLIRYTPVHGDLRGPIILLTPPEHIKRGIERQWRAPGEHFAASHS
jgi:hypothetical protein